MFSWSSSAGAEKPIFDTLSFADEVVLFAEGDPAARHKPNNSPTLVLGAPSRNQPSLTLGCGGILVVRFTDNALIDVDGPDLYIYEIGPNIEATKVDISTNARDWIHIGQVAGATASLDIHAYVQPNQSFSYVRLTDLKQSCQSSTPGADIDAIAAIGSAARYRFSGAVLFDFDQAKLKTAATDVLQQWLEAFGKKSGRLHINGHTDQRGDEIYNLKLSLQRAQAVAHFLQPKLGQNVNIKTHGLGESEPLFGASNSKQAAKNRRVEIIYFPH